METLSVRFERRRLSPAGRWFLFATVLLACGGWILVFSASSTKASLDGDVFRYFFLQGRGLLLGGFALVVASLVPPRWWLRLAPAFGLLTVALLLLVLTPLGNKAGGARRWLNFGLTFQPSELAKIAVPLLIAWCIDRYPLLHLSRRDVESTLSGTELASRWNASLWRRRALRVAQLVGLGLIVFLIAIEPDLGTAAFVLGVGISLLWLSKLPFSYLVGFGLAGAPFVVLILARRSLAELLQRFDGFFRPETVYQVWVSLTTIASGEWFGKGIGNSQAKELYLPAGHNDFIFAIYAEEFGFVGVVLLLTLYSILLQAGWRAVKDCPYPALRILGLGLVVNLALQAIINIAVSTALAPTKGIGLPFISYGSTSLTVALFAVGMILSISRLSIDRRREG